MAFSLANLASLVAYFFAIRNRRLGAPKNEAALGDSIATSWVPAKAGIHRSAAGVTTNGSRPSPGTKKERKSLGQLCVSLVSEKILRASAVNLFRECRQCPKP